MTTVLLTGGAGFIGSNIADRYIAEGYRVVIVDNLSTGRRENLPSEAVFYEADITDPAIADIFEEHRPEILNHHAAQINVRLSVEDPLLDARVNILGFVNLLAACRKFPPRHAIFASSGGAIYGDDVPRPTPEEARLEPMSPYGIAKLAGEHYLRCFAGEVGFSATILRYANVYGPRQNALGEAGVVAIFFDRLLKGEIPIINGDGRQTRDYVYVGDLVKINALAARERLDGTFNVGTGRETSVNTLAEMIVAYLGRQGESLPHGPAKPGEQRASCLDAARIRRHLDSDFAWTPFEEGLEKTGDYFQETVKRTAGS